MDHNGAGEPLPSRSVPAPVSTAGSNRRVGEYVVELWNDLNPRYGDFGVRVPPLPDDRLHPLQAINFVLKALDDIELTLSRTESSVDGNNLELVQEFSGDMQTASTPLRPSAIEPSRESATESPIGFLGGAALADAIGIHVTRRDAFFRQLERRRMSLGDDCWHEVREPRPNAHGSDEDMGDVNSSLRRCRSLYRRSDASADGLGEDDVPERW